MPKSTASIVKTRSGKFRVKYYAANGEMLACSEELKTKASAKKNIRAMVRLCRWVTISITGVHFDGILPLKAKP